MANHRTMTILGACACITVAASCSSEDSPGAGSAGRGGGGVGGDAGSLQNGGSSAGVGATAGAAAGGSGGLLTGGGAAGAAAGGSIATGGTDGGASGGGGDAAASGADAGGAGGAAGAGDAGASGSTGAAGAAGAANDGPILEYHFEEGSGTVVADSSGRALDGTLSDSGAWSLTGRSGNALSLSGGTPPTQYLTLPSGVLSGVSSLTIASWVLLDSDPAWNRVFDFGNAEAGADRFMYLTPASDQGIRFSIFGGSAENEATVTTGTRLPLNTWKHVAVTAENGEHYVYVDGFPAGHASSVVVPPSEMEPMSPGSWLGKSRFPDGGFDGLMDDFVIYDRVLTADELYELAWPKSDYSNWRFEEAGGTAAADSSDRSIDATLVDGALWTSGRRGAGVLLSGTDEYVSFESNPLAGCTTEVTIAIWVKLNAAAQWARIFDFGTPTGYFMFLTPRNETNGLRFSLHTPTEDTDLISATTIPTDSSWHHVAAVVSASAATLYLDGTSVANVASPAVAPNELGDMTENWLGKSRFGTDPFLSAALDELRISCRAFTADEIKSLAFNQ